MTGVMRRWLVWSVCLAGPGLGCSADGVNDAPGAAGAPTGPTRPDPEPVEPGTGVFESADPAALPRGRGAPELGTGGLSAGPSAPGTPTAPPVDAGGGDSPQRAIEEADVIKIEGGLLYALSRHGGLSVIDVSRRDELVLLGRHKLQATPFEMYVRDGLVFALYTGYGDYAFDDEEQTWTYYQTSYVVALDARDPEAITITGKFPIAGDLADSRIVGDVLYVAAYENGGCWGCETTPRTNLISLDVSDPAELVQVDELGFAERTDGYSWRRSVMATDQRLYVAGPTWGNTDQPVGSTIQIVDISDPSGRMVAGDSVQVAGQINSRWQMDEFEGVLRVVSQPMSWSLDQPPTVATYTVVSSDELDELASFEMRLPRPEQLQSVRFDGSRGYAVTFERTDPLFTLDLSDPARPRQVGELEMPGFLYHMEPRGDRLLGLGFDQGNAEGALTVSLFDVADLAQPTMIDRVNFGGTWASLAEDQDRIHKAFSVLDDQGLVLVPFSGWQDGVADENGCSAGRYLSGVQLVDFANDQLDLRGVAPARGQARRGFVHDERLFAMSDERIESFDISDRSAPELTATIAIARSVNQVHAAGDKLVRFGSDWWTDEPTLDVTTLERADSLTASGTLPLPQLGQRQCLVAKELRDVRTNADRVYLTYQSFDYRSSSRTKVTTNVATVDVSDASSPEILADAPLELTPVEVAGGHDAGLGSSPGVNVGSTLAFVSRASDYEPGTDPGESVLHLFDLSDPAAPVSRTLELPPSRGGSALLVSESVIATSHFVQSPTNPERLRFYLDRVDLTDPQNPVLRPSVNVPGSLVAYDEASGHAITSDSREHEVSGITARACYETYGYAGFEVLDAQGNPVGSYDFETTLGTCRTLQYALRLIEIEDDRARVIDSFELEPGQTPGSVALGDDRLFVTVAQGGYYYGGIGLPIGPGSFYGFSSQKLELLVLGGLRTGRFEAGLLELPRGDQWGPHVPLVASGARAVISTGFRGELTLVDATDAAAPASVRPLELAGYVYDLDLIDGVAVVALGLDGVQTLSIRD